MKLIKEIESTRNKKGYKIKRGLFLCPFCFQEVERELSNGKRQKSCGCVRYKLMANSNTGKKRTEETKQKIRDKAIGRKSTEETRKLLSEQRKGGKNPMYGVDRSGEKAPNFGKPCSEEAKQKIRISEIGKIVSEDTKQKIKENHRDCKGKNNPMYGKSGELSPVWNNGSSFESYGIEFNKPLKQSILERDNYTCQNPLCNIEKPKRLHIHHIDYDKKNNISENLITLCINCHMKTNSKNKRQYFTEYYSNIIGKILIC